MCRRQNRLLLLISAALVTASGCSLLPKNKTQDVGKQQGKENVAILYRTNSDRLNLLAAQPTEPIRRASYQQHSATLIPAVSISTLQIRYPHPTGRKDLAQAVVAFSPAGVDSALQSESILDQIPGLGKQASDERAAPIETWTLDIPKWQVDGIVAKLQKANFFRRAKILGSTSYLAVKTKGNAFGKNYRNVDELDALIVRVRRQGHPAGPDGRPLVARRPTPMRAPATAYQAGRPMPRHPSPNGYRPNFNDRRQPQPPRYRPNVPSGYQYQQESQGSRRSHPPAMPGYEEMPINQARHPNPPGHGQPGPWNSDAAYPQTQHDPPTFRR